MESSMRIGYLSTLYHTSFILKNKPSDYLKNYSLDWTLFATGPAMMEAFRSGNIDMGYIGLPPVMIGIENGLDIKCVGGGHVEGTVMIGSSYYKSYDELGDVSSVLNQFEGKSIGTPTRGSIHDIIMRQLTCRLDVKIKNYSWADFIPEALEYGEIAAGMGTPSLASAAQQIDSQIIIPPHKLWPYNPSYGIVVKEELIEKNPNFIRDFLKAHEDACNLIRTQRETAAEIVLQEIGTVNKEFILNTFNISPRYCASLPEEYIQSTLKFIPVLQDLKYMQNRLNRDEIFETKYIQEIHPEPSHY
jgi:NitT/TauT family transport system substrate-binding protein